MQAYRQCRQPMLHSQLPVPRFCWGAPCSGDHHLLQAKRHRSCARHAQQSSTSSQPNECVLDIWTVSDIHADHSANMDWVRTHMPPNRYGPNSVLLVAGDISDNINVLREVLSILKAAFWQVVYVPGNHELWVKGRTSREGEPGSATDSLGKLQQIQALCDELGVHMRPVRLGRLVVAPILSWHHQSWDQEPDIPDNLVPRASPLTISDYARCVWPGELDRPLGSLSVAEHLDGLNPAVLRMLEARGSAPPHAAHHSSMASQAQAQQGLQLITMSHFLPSQQLLPEKRFLTYPNLAKAVGSLPLYDRIRRLKPTAHVFGHTHFAWDAVLPCCGVRCIQAPLCYPAERQKRMRSITMHPENSNWQAFHPGPQHGPEWLPLLLGRARFQLVQGDSQQQHNSSAPHAESGQLDEVLPCLILERAGALQQSSQDTTEACRWSLRDWSLELCPDLSAMWSDHYKSHIRTPEDTELAPWVAPRYQRMRARRKAVVEA